jgi:hypothetical protein
MSMSSRFVRLTLALAAGPALLTACGDSAHTPAESGNRQVATSPATDQKQGAPLVPAPNSTPADTTTLPPSVNNTTSSSGPKDRAMAQLLPSVGAGASAAPAAAATGKVFLNLPHGITIQAREGSFEDAVATFLSTGKPGASKSFVLERVHTDSAGSGLTQDSTEQVENLTAILKAFPNADVRFEGAAGGGQASRSKVAHAVKTALVIRGVAAERVAVSEQGATTGSGVDVVVTKNYLITYETPSRLCCLSI